MHRARSVVFGLLVALLILSGCAPSVAAPPAAHPSITASPQAAPSPTPVVVPSATTPPLATTTPATVPTSIPTLVPTTVPTSTPAPLATAIPTGTQGPIAGAATAAEAGTPTGAHVIVEMKNYAFVPKDITITTGTTVTWRNADNTTHTATADNKLFDSGNLGPSAQFSYTFTKPGVYPYYCIWHGAPGGVGMSGTITVK
jgi:plastocyanin